MRSTIALALSVLGVLLIDTNDNCRVFRGRNSAAADAVSSEKETASGFVLTAVQS